MKIKLVLIAATLIIAISACSKNDDDGIKLQAHDQNRLMDSMHVMMARMEMNPMTNDPEIDFARMMIIHHQGAIGMANVELQAGSNNVIKGIAQQIITDQQMEIMELQSILSTQTVNNVDMEFSNEHMEAMMKMEKTADVQIITGDIDNDFATLMIVHHQTASDNAASYLHHGNNAQLKAMATEMIRKQTMEIQELAEWLKANRR